jgi:hypothetical protein
MALPKFIVALKSLSEDEKKNFEKYVTLYHLPESEVSGICKFLTKTLPNIKSETTLQEIRGKKYQKHTDKGFANYLSVLYNLLEDWIVKQSLDSDPQLKDVLLIRGFQNHGLYVLADRYYTKTSTLSDNHYYNLLYKWMAHFEVYFSHNPHKYKTGALAAHEMADSFKNFTIYTAEILKAELINWSLLFPFDPQADLLFLEKFAGQNPENSKDFFLPQISGLLRHFDLNTYLDLVYSFLQDPPENGSFEEIIYTFYLLRLYTMAKKRSQESMIPETINSIYDFAFTRGVFNQKGKLMPHNFRNLVNNVAEINSLPFSLEFIEKYSPFVHSDCPKDSKDVCIAMAFLKHDHYDDVIQHTNHKTFHDAAEKIQCYSMHLAAWFVKRKSEPDVYQNVLNSFLGYFKRNPDNQSQEIVNSYLNFASVLKDIDKGINPVNMSKHTNLMNRNWLTKYIKNHKIDMI